MSAPIFYISTEEYDALTPGATCALSGSEGKHALVKRLELGERIDLGDGTYRRALGTVASINADGVSVQVQELREERSVPSIYLVQALAKDYRDLLAIETATELGVYGVLPWSADRSIVRWKGSAPPRHTPSGRTPSPPRRSSRAARSFPKCTTCTAPPTWWNSLKKLLGRVLSSPPPCSSCMSRRPNASAPWYASL